MSEGITEISEETKEQNVYLTQLEDEIITLKRKVQGLEDVLIKFRMMAKR